MKILFMGDSITDTGRNAGAGSMLSIGQGYAMLVTGKLAYERPGQFEFVNSGISGNRVVDLYARIKGDCWNHCPDVLSILVGVNDVGHEFANGNGVDAKRFEHVYETLIEETMERLPHIKIILMEPFILPGTGTNANWQTYEEGVKVRGQIVARIAKKYGCAFVPLQEKFCEAAAKWGAEYWIADGIHPTPAGHGLIANEWFEAFDRLFPCVKNER